MFRTICISLCFSVIVFTCTSCATLFEGTTEEIQLASDPSGATATINDGASGTTPYSLEQYRNRDLQIHFSKPGYQSQEISDTSHVQWGYLVSDIFFTGLIGLAVDGLDGAMFAHSQQMVAAHLVALPTRVGTYAPSPAEPIAAQPVQQDLDDSMKAE
jgi:hypothetical protein